MSCLFPIRCFRANDGTTSFKPIRTDEKRQIIQTGEFYVPCGQCGECRLSRARSWATRCTHEASLWKKNCFITLTYKDMPPGESLNPNDTRNFIRNLRYAIKQPFKYFLCGEYGEKNNRPHYHAIIFGYDFGLSEHTHGIDPTRNPNKDFKSHSQLKPLLQDSTALSCPELDFIWGLGHTSVGEMTFDSACYTAQYSMKKVNGSKAKDHYRGRHPEFMRFSRDGIGKQYAQIYADEIISHNSVMSNGQIQSIPKYYLKLYEKQNKNLDQLKQKREEYSSTHTLEKSYIRAQQLDAKFKLKISKADAFRIRYLTDRFHNDLIPGGKK